MVSRPFRLLPVLLAGAATWAWAALPAVRWLDPVELVRGAGTRGPWQQNASRYDFVDDPAVALARDGTVLVAWVDQSRKAVLVQRRAADGTAAPPVDIDRQPATFSWIPRLAIAPDAQRQVYALWQEIIFSGGSHGGDMMMARSVDGGRSFSPPLNISSSRGGDGKGRITPDVWHNGSYDLLAMPGGRVAAAWTEYDGQLWFAQSTDGGQRFGRPQLVAGAPGSPGTRAPSLAQARDGAVLLAWTEGDQPGADVRVARWTGSRFAPAVVVGASRSYSDAPSLAVDGQGVVHLVYAESEAGPFDRHRIVHARSTDGGRRFSGPGNVADALPGGHASAGYPTVAVGAGDTLVVQFELQRDAGQRPTALGVVLSGDGGASFTVPVVVPHGSDPGGGANGSSQGLLVRKLAVHADRIAIANSSLREGSHSRVWLVMGDLRR